MLICSPPASDTTDESSRHLDEIQFTRVLSGTTANGTERWSPNEQGHKNNSTDVNTSLLM